MPPLAGFPICAHLFGHFSEQSIEHGESPLESFAIISERRLSLGHRAVAERCKKFPAVAFECSALKLGDESLGLDPVVNALGSVVVPFPPVGGARAQGPVGMG